MGLVTCIRLISRNPVVNALLKYLRQCGIILSKSKEDGKLPNDLWWLSVSFEKRLDKFDKRLEEMGVRIKDADQFKVSEDVFDDITLLALYRACP